MKHLLTALCCLAAGLAQADYTKIANNGWALPATAALGPGPFDWACTRDNVTNLTWEVKTSDGGLRDQNKTYTNYDDVYDPGGVKNAAGNSLGFVNAVNAAGLCGRNDWRRPTNDELLGLVDTNNFPTIDATYFPNTPAWLFWSGSPIPGDPENAWHVPFYGGYDYWGDRGNANHVRLVRAGQLIDHFDLAVTPTGAGAGSVVIGGLDATCFRGGGAILGVCTARPANGATVTLTATAAPGSTTTWGGDCAGTSGATCTLTMDASKTVTVDFSAPVATRAVLIDPDTPATLYAALDGAGVYVSSNDGASWSAANPQPGNLNLKALARKSGTPLYAGGDGGVFKSTNGGASFSACGGLPGNPKVLSLSLGTGGKLYAGTEAGVFASTDQCAAWSAINNGLPN